MPVQTNPLGRVKYTAQLKGVARDILWKLDWLFLNQAFWVEVEIPESYVSQSYIYGRVFMDCKLIKKRFDIEYSSTKFFACKLENKMFQNV